MSLGKKDRLSWSTRLRLCWNVLTKGKYNWREYRTRHDEEQWLICEQRREEMDACVRERRPFPYSKEEMEQ